jgi:hypothetical protein
VGLVRAPRACDPVAAVARFFHALPRSAAISIAPSQFEGQLRLRPPHTSPDDGRAGRSRRSAEAARAQRLLSPRAARRPAYNSAEATSCARPLRTRRPAGLDRQCAARWRRGSRGGSSKRSRPSTAPIGKFPVVAQLRRTAGGCAMSSNHLLRALAPALGACRSTSVPASKYGGRLGRSSEAELGGGGRKSPCRGTGRGIHRAGPAIPRSALLQSSRLDLPRPILVRSRGGLMRPQMVEAAVCDVRGGCVRARHGGCSARCFPCRAGLCSLGGEPPRNRRSGAGRCFEGLVGLGDLEQRPRRPVAMSSEGSVVDRGSPVPSAPSRGDRWCAV